MTEADWQALLDQEPANDDLRLQFSDWLEEEGRMPEAEVQRWLVRTGKRPNPSIVDWEWWEEGQRLLDPTALPYLYSPPRAIPHRELPTTLFRHLPGAQGVSYRAFSSRRAAEEALARAWSSLKEAGGSLP
jgi:uncharacterized protein (TIGR02996 family)